MEIKWFIMIMEMYSILVQYTLYYLSLHLIIIDISGAFIYFHCYFSLLNNMDVITNINANTETVIY